MSDGPETLPDPVLDADPSLLPTPEEPAVDIHKPKPVHSWREFLIEIGTITCGILIALGLEQVVEQMHARHEAELLDQTLRVEVTRDLGEALQESAFYYCVRTQVATASAQLNRSSRWPGAVEPKPGMSKGVFGTKIFATLPGADALTIPDEGSQHTPGFVTAGASAVLIPAPRSTLLSRSWQAAVASPGLLTMDRRRRDRYGTIYYHIDQIENAIADAWTAREELAALSTPQTLTEPERRQYLGVLARIDMDNRAVSALTGLLVAFSAKNGIRPDPTDVAERLEPRKPVWGGCMRFYVVPPKAVDWANKFESDRDRLIEESH